MANLTDADKVIRNDVGKSIVSKLDDIADAIVQHGGGAESLGQLSDVDIDTTTLSEGQSIVYNETTQKFENGQVSTVGGLNDLDDVTLTNVANKQELVYDGNADVFKNKTTRIELTQAQYDALANPDPDVDYYITDAPSMQGTSADLSYDGGTESVYDVVEQVKNDVNSQGVARAITPTSTKGTFSACYQSVVGDMVIVQGVFACSENISAGGGVAFTLPNGLKSGTNASNFLMYDNSAGVNIHVRLANNGDVTPVDSMTTHSYRFTFAYLK